MNEASSGAEVYDLAEHRDAREPATNAAVSKAGRDAAEDNPALRGRLAEILASTMTNDEALVAIQNLAYPAVRAVAEPPQHIG